MASVKRAAEVNVSELGAGLAAARSRSHQGRSFGFDALFRPQRSHGFPINLEAEARCLGQVHAASAMLGTSMEDAVVDRMVSIVTRGLCTERRVAEC